MELFHEFNILSVFVRLVLAMTSGGILGYGRSKKNRAAGLRTYMLISMAACLTVLLGCYDFEMLKTGWAEIAAELGMKFDASRYASQVITGIGFLGAGTILSAEHQQVSGLTTAIGLFASAITGLAAGMGLYTTVLVVLLLLIFSIEVMYPVEKRLKRRMRQFTVYVEYENPRNLAEIIDFVKEKNATIFDVDIERTKKEDEHWPGAIIVLRLAKESTSHSEMMTSIAELSCVHAVKELVS